MNSTLKTASTKSKTIVNSYIKNLQYSHFWWYNFLPLIGTVAALISCLWIPIGPTEIIMIIILWALTTIGISVGFHRYYAHRSFKTGKAMQMLFVVLGSLAGQGSLISWVAVHRRHHENSDTQGDPHSPNLHGCGIWNELRGLWHSHYGWLVDHEYPNPGVYASDLLRDRAISKVSRRYSLWVGLGVMLPAIIGGWLHGTWTGALQGLLWGGAVRLFMVDNIVLSVNSFSHLFGTQPFETGDNSRNNAWLCIPTLGESWQNNHHGFASSAAIGLKWWQIDLGYWVIWILEKLGLVWDVNRPTAKMIEAKKL
jgi:stearoyl-CoA desaturase (Delta-9 desaturase)